MTASFSPSGVISLTTDFGHQGPFVATMKAVMLTRHPSVKVVDLTHETSVHFPAEAGFWLKRSFVYFPKGTVHVAVVDPGVGTERDIVAMLHHGHAFIAPDNGLLAPIVDDGATDVHTLDMTRLSRFGIDAVSATFHGRDIFAPLGAEMAVGRLKPADLGPKADGVVPSWVEPPIADATKVKGVIIALDNFGNLISNIDAELFAAFSNPVVMVSNHRVPVRRTYGDVKPGAYLALVNSFGVLEIARAEQSAAEGLGLGRGAPVTVVDA